MPPPTPMPTRRRARACPHLRHRACSLLALLGLTAGLIMLAGCSTPRDPNAPLTADEGAELLREIRNDPVGRKQNLTPAERAYLVKTLKK